MTFKTNRRPNFKRNNNYSSKGRNKGNVTQQYNKYLKLAKDTFSSGDRIQAEYYYQFTDHYYRLMVELGLSLEDQDLPDDSRITISENSNIEDGKETNDEDAEKPVIVNVKNVKEEDVKEDEEEDQSIESVPFISEPVKKKRTRTVK